MVSNNFSRENIWRNIPGYDFAAGRWTKSTNLGAWVDVFVFDYADIELESIFFRSVENFSAGTNSSGFTFQLVDPSGALNRAVSTGSSMYTPTTSATQIGLTELICKRRVTEGSRIQAYVTGPLTSGQIDFTFLMNIDSIDANIRVI
jgi:hypothetical protein